MSLKFQIVAAVVTAGTAASIATPLVYVSNSSAYSFSFDESTVKKVIKDASDVYSSKKEGERLEEILNNEMIQKFLQLIKKVSSTEKEEKLKEGVEQKLTAEDRKVLAAFYAAYSLLDKRSSDLSETFEEDGEISSEFKNVKAGIILNALEQLSWSEETTSLSTKVKENTDNWNSSPLRFFYSQDRSKVSTLSESGVELGIATWLLKEMDVIYKNRN